jgi:hypothetical protein
MYHGSAHREGIIIDREMLARSWLIIQAIMRHSKMILPVIVILSEVVPPTVRNRQLTTIMLWTEMLSERKERLNLMRIMFHPKTMTVKATTRVVMEKEVSFKQR